MKQLLTRSIIFSLFFASTIANAANYRSEVSYYTYTADYQDDTDELVGGASYTHHFEKVGTTARPLAEAAYLARTSYIMGWLFGQDVDYKNGNDRLGTGMGAEFVHRSSQSPLILEVAYTRARYDHQNSAGTTLAEWNETHLDLTAGWYLSSTTAVKLQIAKTDYDFLKGGSKDYSTTDMHLMGKKIVDSKSQNPINLEGSVGFVEYGSDKDENRVLSVGGDFYFTRRHSLGLLYKNENGDEKQFEGTTTTIRGRFFFTSRLSLAIEKENFDAENKFGVDYDKTSLEVFYRF
ncbi:MAG: hypothetical protein OEY52_13325 [Gammaproteobacteria bacterium]|nr:hypothetical protein [Gammaproteobacteria bacterium]